VSCNCNKLHRLKVKVLPTLQITGRVLITCFNSLKPAGPVRDVTLDTWRVHRSDFRDLLQQSPTIYTLTPELTDPEGWNSESGLSAPGSEPGPRARMSEHASERLTI
jgi:hypothetical protein